LVNFAKVTICNTVVIRRIISKVAGLIAAWERLRCKSKKMKK